MPEVQPAAASNPAPNLRRVTELKVSGHLMMLDNGLFCILQTPSPAANRALGLPGVRLSLPPGPASRPEAVTVMSFRPDGWLSSIGDAALVRVLGGPAQILVTVYQEPNAIEGAPNLQVMRLLEDAAGPRVEGPGSQPVPAAAIQLAAVQLAAARPAAGAPQPKVMEMVAHVQGRGDLGAMIGDWLGERGSKRWIEGFGIAPLAVISMQDIEYQAVFGRDWLSSWIDSGQFCGSRGMATPIVGLRVRLRGQAAETHAVSYSATFIDGTAVGPVAAGEVCEAASLAPVEAFQVVLRPKDQLAEPAAPVAAVEPEQQPPEAEPPASAPQEAMEEPATPVAAIEPKQPQPEAEPPVPVATFPAEPWPQGWMAEPAAVVGPKQPSLKAEPSARSSFVNLRSMFDSIR